jgi:hypothetical protein
MIDLKKLFSGHLEIRATYCAESNSPITGEGRRRCP